LPARSATILIGNGVGVAVGFAVGDSVVVLGNAGTGVFVVVVVFVGEVVLFAGMVLCVVQAVTKSAIFTKTNKIFFIMFIKNTVGSG
jgi:hypothetical protein